MSKKTFFFRGATGVIHRLHDVLLAQGSVVAINAPFELGRLEECCDLLTEFRAWLKDFKRRMIDLLVPFRGFCYHHPKQHGSASMKAVLPALTGKGYGHLAVQLSLRYLHVSFGVESEADRATVRKQLEANWCLDTLGMFRIVEGLRNLILH